MKKYNYIIIAFFLLQISVHAGYLLKTTYGKEEESNINVQENRELASLPEATLSNYLSGDFSKGFETYVDDHFAYRDFYIEKAKDYSIVYEIFPKGAVKDVFSDKPEIEKQTEISPVKLASSITMIDNNRLVEEYRFSAENQKNVIESMQKIIDKVNAENTYIMIPYTTEYYYLNKKYISEEKDQALAADKFKKEIKNANFLDLDSEIKNHLDELLFFRMDHHWTSRGAFCAYNVFLKELGKESKNIDDYERKSIPGFQGSLYNKIAQSRTGEIFKDEFDEIEYFLPKNEYSVYGYQNHNLKEATESKLFEAEQNEDGKQYDVFLDGGNYPITQIKSSVDNDKKILIIKDSYSHAFVPFLVDDYSEIFLIEPRLFNKEHDNFDVASFFNENAIDDLMFISYNLMVSSEYWTNISDSYKAIISD